MVWRGVAGSRHSIRVHHDRIMLPQADLLRRLLALREVSTVWYQFELSKSSARSGGKPAQHSGYHNRFMYYFKQTFSADCWLCGK
jgi:hypothetical protein